MSVAAPNDSSTLADWIARRVQMHPGRSAVTYLDDDGPAETWTYQDLWNASCAVAQRLSNDQPGERALLLFPQGLNFLAAFLGCQLARLVPVPTCFPKPHREMPRLNSAADDCQPRWILSDTTTLASLNHDKLSASAKQAELVSLDEHIANRIDCDTVPEDLSRDDIAFLQYTSGSTSAPKGVQVRHRNLMSNLETIRRGFQIEFQDGKRERLETGVFWLPFYHDMGLIGGLLEPLYIGGHTVVMSPRAFLQRPLRWLQAISDYNATISGAPNFAFQLCVDRIPPEQSDGLSLHTWRLAFSGAEPVLPRTLKEFSHRFESCGFRSQAFYPCYGMAESTLLVAGGKGPGEPTVVAIDRVAMESGEIRVLDDEAEKKASKRDVHRAVGCGFPAYGTQLLVVHPETHQILPERTIGEIWVRGSSVTDGYWNRPDENAERFNKVPVGDPAVSLDSNGEPQPTTGFCRSGDMGFLHDGQVFLTGRHKDMIIIRGRNLFPKDIEVTVGEIVGPEFGQCVAIAAQSTSSESLALVIESPRRSDSIDFSFLVREIRRAVIEVHEVDPQHVWFVRLASVPMTTSGKVQRSLCKSRFETQELKTLHQYDRSSFSEQSPIAFPEIPSPLQPSHRDQMVEAIESWMSQWLVCRAGVAPADIDGERPLEEYGLDSLTAVELSGETEDWSGVELTPLVAWNHPNISSLSKYIVGEMIQCADSGGQAT